MQRLLRTLYGDRHVSAVRDPVRKASKAALLLLGEGRAVDMRRRLFSRAPAPIYAASEIVNAPLLPPVCEFWAIDEVVAVAPGGLELSILDSDVEDGLETLVVDGSIVVEAIDADPGWG